MPEVTIPKAIRPVDSPRHEGVRGWLLILCLMMTVVGPLISAGLMATEYLSSAPRFAGSRVLELAVYLSIALEAGSAAIGIYAGTCLWSVRPGAVDTAKRALLLGLAVSIVTTALSMATGPEAIEDGQFLRAVTMNLIPDLVFFTLCFSYLNRSLRVHLTYPR